MSLYSHFVRRFGGRRWFAAIASRVAPGLDRIVYRLSRGRRIATPSSVPTLFLTTTGRRSGEPRTSALSFIGGEAEPIVVGTNWGKPHHPAWSANLIDDPRATIEYRGRRWQVTAVLVPVDDRAPLWADFDALYPAYASYRARLNRVPRMFRLVPR